MNATRFLAAALLLCALPAAWSCASDDDGSLAPPPTEQTPGTSATAPDTTATAPDTTATAPDTSAQDSIQLPDRPAELPDSAAELPLRPDEKPAAPDTLNIKPHIMHITIGNQTFTATLSDTEAARALAARLPLTLTMRELNGNEKYANLASALPTAARRPGTIRMGDVMLYGSDCLVLFYETFSTSYGYTPIGRINEPQELARAVGRGSVRVTFTL